MTTLAADGAEVAVALTVTERDDELGLELEPDLLSEQPARPTRTIAAPHTATNDPHFTSVSPFHWIRLQPVPDHRSFDCMAECAVY
jgi:hypothetical protein